MNEELCYLGAREALTRFEARSLSPVELLDALLARAEQVEPRVRAFTHTFPESARAAARRAEERYARPRSRRRRPLEGLPLAVKDESQVAGQPITQGSLRYRDQIARETAPSIERLLRAGAIVHARSATPEFSCAGVTHSRLHGVTRNPWRLASTPGGSSGGSGAALAAGTTPLATGTDIWGSIRIPASCCGVVGLKPSHGRVPSEPPFNLDPYNHEGPMARSVTDCALLLDVMGGPHPRDAASLRPKLRLPKAEALGDVSGWRVAWSPDLGFARVDPAVARNTERAVEVFRELGCAVERVELGWGDEVLTAAKEHLLHLFGTSVAREIDRGGSDDLTAYARDFGERARHIRPEGFLHSMEVAGAMYATLGPLLERHHVLVCPTTALAALPAEHDPTRDPVRIAGREVDPVFGWILTWPFNVLGRCPAISVPSGLDPEGVPTGIQIVARHYDDLRVLRAADAYERALGGFPRLSWPHE